MRFRLPRPTLLQAFGVVGLLVIVALGATLGAILHARIERRAVADAQRLAVTIARVGVAGQLRPGEPDNGALSRTRVAALDRWFASSGLLRGKFYDQGGRIVWSDDHAFIGRDASRHPDVREALAGETNGHVEDDAEELGAKGRFLEVYVPIQGGVFEGYLSYAPTARAIAADTRILVAALVAGLLLLWAALFRTVASASRRLRHQATHDSLTGLSNRSELYEDGERALAAARRDGNLAALLLIDLDRFKEVNDTMGHDKGDRLLVDVAARLRGVLRGSDILARLGGDEFAVLAALPNRGALGEVATRLHAALALPFEVGGVAIELGASLGIALQPDHREDVTTLLRHADVAMYEAKRTATSIETYTPERDPTPPSASRCSASCGAGSTTTSSSCTSSRRSRSTAGASSASRRSCAGSTPSAGSSAPANSSPWPSAPGSSRTSRAGCSTPRSASAANGAARARSCRSP
jgi:diguanylate cyclase (GGDEF)-like protein